MRKLTYREGLAALTAISTKGFESRRAREGVSLGFGEGVAEVRSLRLEAEVEPG